MFRVWCLKYKKITPLLCCFLQIVENSSVNSNNDSKSQNSESLEETQHFESMEDNNTEENSNDAVINNNESNRIEREQIENAAPQFVIPAKKTVKN